MNREFYLINDIFRAGVIEAFDIYSENKELLKDWMFIGCDNKGINHIRKVILTKEIANNFWLINFFKYPYIYFIEYRTFLKDKVAYFIDYSVSMDTQILSYMKRYIFNAKENIPKGFNEVLNYLILNDINVDPFEYLYENYKDIDEHINDVKMTLYAYEIFKNTNKDYWLSSSLLMANKKHSEIMNTIEWEIREYKKGYPSIRNYQEKVYNVTYICLLEMVIIELKYKAKTWHFKLNLYLKYLNDILGVMVHREIIIAQEYFKKGQNLRFFKKISKDMKKPFTIIKNMTWDLYHIHNIERNKLLFVLDDAYYIPCLLTYDFGLAEITKLCNIKKMAINTKTRQIIINYVEMDEIRSNEKFSKWFTDEAFFKRKPIENIDEEIKRLEQELINVLSKLE